MSNLLKSSAVLVTPSILKLEVRGGHVPSFKNQKQLIPGNPLRLITNPGLKCRKTTIEDAIVSALLSDSRIESNGTSTGDWPLSLMLSLLPEDDCWSCVPSIQIETEFVAEGEEGFDLVIERL